MLMLKLKSIFISLTAFLIALSVATPQVYAQARSLTVRPPKFELFGNPGDTVTEQIQVTNNSNFPVTYALLIEDFGSSGEEGHVVLEEETNDAAYSLAEWIEPAVQEVILQPNETTTVNFAVNVPRDAEPGGHYASILFESGENPDPSVTTVSQRIGTLVLLRVSGNIEEAAQIESFDAPGRVNEGPVNFTLRLNNQGNVHVRPKGTVIVTNMFGQKVDEIPLEGANVLPGATRRMEISWDDPGTFGSYTATLVATYGQQNLPLTAATKFNVLSNTALILGGVAILAAIFFLFSIVSGRGRLIKALKVLTKG